ncbi:MAG TPA: ABC transporter permease, partial [Coleofasciculaceae cyanobacterium]
LWELAVTGELFRHIGITLYRVALGFVMGAAIATVLGALTGYSRLFHGLLDPLLQSLRNIPSLAWVPLFILWMGIYETSKIALIAVGVFFPVYLNLMSGIQGVDRKLVEVGKVHRLNSLQLIQRVFLPATLPAYIVGLRSGLGLGWMFVVAAEIMGSSQGLGFLLVDGQTTGRPTIILASILLFAVFGKLTDAGLATIGNRLLYWQDSYHSQP